MSALPVTTSCRVVGSPTESGAPDRPEVRGFPIRPCARELPTRSLSGASGPGLLASQLLVWRADSRFAPRATEAISGFGGVSALRAAGVLGSRRVAPASSGIQPGGRSPRVGFECLSRDLRHPHRRRHRARCDRRTVRKTSRSPESQRAGWRVCGIQPDSVDRVETRIAGRLPIAARALQSVRGEGWIDCPGLQEIADRAPAGAERARAFQEETAQ